MMRKIFIAITLAVVVCLGGICGESSGPDREIPLPTVPSGLRQPAERAAWLVRHFWDRMNWDDSRLTSDSLMLEQNMSNYFSVMPLADSVARAEGVRAMLTGIGTREGLKNRIAEIGRRYLDGLSSPVRDEESFLSFSEVMLEAGIDEPERSRTEYERGEILRGRVGSMAPDLTVSTLDGRKSLRELMKPGVETMLIFYDVDCRDCHIYMESLAANPETTAAIEEGKLRVIAIEAYGADAETWEADAARYPGNWTVGRSEEEETEEAYSLRRTPTVYLIDREGRVKSRN